jgi:hypothetical protein
MDRKKPYRTTIGLNQECDRTTHAAEQVYVQVDDALKPSHPILLESHIGYEVTGKIRVSKRQAAELIGLLAEAVAGA